MTALGGLPVYLDLAQVLGLTRSIRKNMQVRRGGQGWADEQVVMALVLLNLAGGSAVDDLRVLEADEGFCRVLERCELEGLRRSDSVGKNLGRPLPPTLRGTGGGFGSCPRD
jgi:hypothetical protein